MNVAVFTDVKPEDKDAILAILDKLGATAEDTVVSETKRKKTRSEINHQNYLNRKAKQSEKSDSQTEEKREEERESFSPSFPSSLSSSPLIPPNNNPITPIIPSSQEQEEERKEPDMGGGAKPKHRHGEFSHVLLTDTDLDRLKDKFPDYEERIQRLDDYLEMHRNKTYSNHYLTILNWARKDGNRPRAKEKTTAEMIAELDWSKYDGSQTV